MRVEKNNSREIRSSQQGIHEDLEKVIRKHCQTSYKKPIAQHTQIAFDTIAPQIEACLLEHIPLVFDSFCGTAVSTRIIAKENPDALVVGIDRSEVRLSKQCDDILPDNALLVQAECADFWLLANRAGWKLAKHYILYPNPYPKPKHLKRRWHAHPVYPKLLTLGGEVELRTNWKVYADEFCQAIKYSEYPNASCLGVTTINFTKNPEFMTLFEKKYQLNGQKLYSCKYSL